MNTLKYVWAFVHIRIEMEKKINALFRCGSNRPVTILLKIKCLHRYAFEKRTSYTLMNNIQPWT